MINERPSTTTGALVAVLLLTLLATANFAAADETLFGETLDRGRAEAGSSASLGARESAKESDQETPMGLPYLDLRIQDGDELYATRPLTPSLYRQLGGDWKDKIDLLLKDREVQFVVARAAEAYGRRTVPVEVILSHTERSAYFHRPRIVLGSSRFYRDGTERAKIVADFKNTILHELGHCLNYRLYQNWLPKVNYKSAEYMNSDTGGHTIDKVTNVSTAWCEGFAEALAAFLGKDDRIQAFKYRRIVYWGVLDPRTLSTLERIEGWDAFLLHDFWLPRDCADRLDRSLDVIAVQERQEREVERHRDILDYVVDHCECYPEDALRWELVLAANTFLAESLSNRLPNNKEQELVLAELHRSLGGIAARHGQVRTAKAAWLYLKSGLPCQAVQPVVAAVERLARRLKDEKDPLFEIPGTSADELETIPLDELRRRVDDAEQTFKGLMQIYGYDFHPRVKEARAYRDKLREVLARRSR